MRPRPPEGADEKSVVEAGDRSSSPSSRCSAWPRPRRRRRARIPVAVRPRARSRSASSTRARARSSGFGAEEYEGFQYGLKYLKAQHNTCGGHKLSVNVVDDQTNPANAVTAAKDLIGQGYKIIVGSTSSGAARAVAPIADQNNVLFISGPAAADAITGLNRHTFRVGPAELPGRRDGCGHPAAEERRQEDRRLRRGHGVRCEQLRGRSAGLRRQGAHGLEDPRAVPGRRPHAVCAAAQERERRPRLRRLGRLQLGRDVAGPRPAESAGHHRGDDGSRRSRPATRRSDRSSARRRSCCRTTSTRARRTR